MKYSKTNRGFKIYHFNIKTFIEKIDKQKVVSGSLISEFIQE